MSDNGPEMTSCSAREFMALDQSAGLGERISHLVFLRWSSVGGLAGV